MINSQPETIIKALKAYQKETGCDELINNLGIMSGRIVRLAEHPDKQINLLKTLQTELKRIQPEINIIADTKVSEYTAWHAPSAMPENPKARPTEPMQECIIRETLKQLKTKYEKEFKAIEKTLITKIIPFEGNLVCSTKTAQGLRNELGFSSFNNVFTPDQWIFQDNSKSKKIDKKSFFMSNVVAHQFETSFKHNKWPMVLPKSIVRENITNKDTDALILKYKGQHDAEAFKREFLNTTVNGKSTESVTKEWSLKIDKLEVKEGDVERYETGENGIDIYQDKTNPFYFSVIVHVSPEPNAWGPNEMD